MTHAPRLLITFSLLLASCADDGLDVSDETLALSATWVAPSAATPTTGSDGVLPVCRASTVHGVRAGQVAGGVCVVTHTSAPYVTSSSTYEIVSRDPADSWVPLSAILWGSCAGRGVKPDPTAWFGQVCQAKVNGVQRPGRYVASGYATFCEFAVDGVRSVADANRLDTLFLCDN